LIATLSPAQLQSIVIGYAGVASVLIPVMAGLVILAIREWGEVKRAAGVVDGQNGTLAALQQAALSHTREMGQMRAQLDKISPGNTMPTEPNPPALESPH
jgi:hypothetical protein